MNDKEKRGVEHRAEGAMDQVKGKARNALGALTGDSSEQLKGKAQEMKGKAKSELGKLEQRKPR
ncbi:CsbD family protein [Gemmatimonas sp.]|uniref:CsbD family protein n=1 Tax=Gemmatimonas sp. TaxID=1962908 RepID=UPI0033419662